MTLNDQRRRIDDLDREILRLLNRRAQMAIQLGEFKRHMGMPLFNPEREEEILRQAQRFNSGPLDDQALASIFTVLLRETRRVTSAILAKTGESKDQVPA